MTCYLIENFENYQICEDGHVYNVRTQRQLVPLVNPRTGYCTVGVMNENGRTGVYHHHLVAKHFLPEPAGEGYEVDHRDANKQNNTPANLQWLTRQQNVRKSIDKTNTSSRFYGVMRSSKDGRYVAQIYTGGRRARVYIGRFATELEAAQAYEKECKKYGLVSGNNLD